MDETHRDAGLLLAGAWRSRRIYAPGAEAARRAAASVHAAIRRCLDGRPQLTIGVLADHLAVDGVLLPKPPVAARRLAERLLALGLEVVAFAPGVERSEVEVLLDLLSATEAELAGESSSQWLGRRGVERIQLRHLQLDERATAQDFRSVYRQATRELGSLFAASGAGKPPSEIAFSRLAQALMDNLLKPELPLCALAALKDRDDRQLVHSVNVACLVGAQARTLGLDEDDVQSLVTAGLTHDLGKTRIPPAILDKQAPLTPSERAWLDRHTLEGGRLLLEAGARLGAVVAFGHHTPLQDGAPGLLAVELTKLADQFDGLRTLALHHRSSAGASIAWLQRRAVGLNPYLLERLARLVDAVPADTEAELSTGERVRVIEPHPELAFHPVVVVEDQGRGRLREGLELDLSELSDRPGLPSLRLPLPPVMATIATEALEELG